MVVRKQRGHVPHDLKNYIVISQIETSIPKNLVKTLCVPVALFLVSSPAANPFQSFRVILSPIVCKNFSNLGDPFSDDESINFLTVFVHFSFTRLAFSTI